MNIEEDVLLETALGTYSKQHEEAGDVAWDQPSRDLSEVSTHHVTLRNCNQVLARYRWEYNQETEEVRLTSVIW
jgi:hypothetical protein